MTIYDESNEIDVPVQSYVRKKVELELKDYILMAVENKINNKPVKIPLQYARHIRA